MKVYTLVARADVMLASIYASKQRITRTHATVSYLTILSRNLILLGITVSINLFSACWLTLKSERCNRIFCFSHVAVICKLCYGDKWFMRLAKEFIGKHWMMFSFPAFSSAHLNKTGEKEK